MSNALKKAQLWFYSYGWAWFILMWYSLRRQRMSHDNGIVARGRLRLVDDPAFPPHDFLQAGREFECRLRHASVSYPDDTVTQVRAASLKFADSAFTSPMDLEMNTGTRSLFWSARNFLEFVRNKQPRVKGLDYWNYYDKHPRGLDAAKDSIRKTPVSFTQLYYHSQCPLSFVGRDGVLRYARYRLVPEDRGPETGLVPPEQLRERWSEDQTDPSLAPDYLRRELAERLARGPVTYHLQIQLHTPVPGESEVIFDSNTPWDEATHPHLELATVRLDSLLPEESVRTWFSMKHLPRSLKVLPAHSIDDYNSLNHMREASDLARRLRVWLSALLGNPSQPVLRRPESPSTRGP